MVGNNYTKLLMDRRRWSQQQNKEKFPICSNACSRYQIDWHAKQNSKGIAERPDSLFCRLNSVQPQMAVSPLVDIDERKSP
jgi:hypothetical protein